DFWDVAPADETAPWIDDCEGSAFSMTGRCHVEESHNFAVAPVSMPDSTVNQRKTCSNSSSYDNAAERFCCELICMPVAAKDPHPDNNSLLHGCP
ncbi:MAG: hypothetical protein ACKPKO_39435, partial [Candidatus Fonsibacter sp.]